MTPAAAAGTLLAVRRPRNPIGWMVLAILVPGFSPTSEYAGLDYRMHHGTLPLGGLAAMPQECWPLFLAFIAILVWVFPDGKLPASRWRRLSMVLIVPGLLIGGAAIAGALASWLAWIVVGGATLQSGVLVRRAAGCPPRAGS